MHPILGQGPHWPRTKIELDVWVLLQLLQLSGISDKFKAAPSFRYQRCSYSGVEILCLPEVPQYLHLKTGINTEILTPAYHWFLQFMDNTWPHTLDLWPWGFDCCMKVSDARTRLKVSESVDCAIHLSSDRVSLLRFIGCKLLLHLH